MDHVLLTTLFVTSFPLPTFKWFNVWRMFVIFVIFILQLFSGWPFTAVRPRCEILGKKESHLSRAWLTVAAQSGAIIKGCAEMCIYIDLYRTICDNLTYLLSWRFLVVVMMSSLLSSLWVSLEKVPIKPSRAWVCQSLVTLSVESRRRKFGPRKNWKYFCKRRVRNKPSNLQSVSKLANFLVLCLGMKWACKIGIFTRDKLSNW